MKLARENRSQIAWMLFASVLFSLFACGLHHGQMSGQSLSGLSGVFCSTDGGKGSAVDLSHSDQSQQAASLACPLCSSFALAVAINASAWALDYLPGNAVAPIVVRSWAQPPPRYLWPSLNPRASPSDFPAVNQSA